MASALESIWDKVPQDSVRSITFSSFRELVMSVGVDVFHMTLIPVEGGYQLRAHTGFRSVQKAYAIKSEKAGQLRVFKSPQSAFHLCSKLGFRSVVVQLPVDACEAA